MQKHIVSADGNDIDFVIWQILQRKATHAYIIYILH
jgi:hypothetical protein